MSLSARKRRQTLPPHIRVSLLQPGGDWAQAGVCLVEPRARGFLYAQDYEGLALDPINLDYQRQGRRFAGGGTLGDATLPNVLHAQLPGAFAWRLLMREQHALAQLDEASRLCALGSITRGALRLEVAGRTPDWPQIQGWKALAKARKVAVQGFLGRVGQIPDALLRSFAAGEGGARPKANVVLSDGSEWVAKFATERDPYNVVRMEHLVHRVAREAGLASVDSRVENLPDGAEVLMMRRYDRDPQGQAMHRIAMADLIGRENNNLADYGSVDFLDYRGVLQRLAPGEIDTLYQMMVLHVALNNTDNHARNFELLATCEGWRLAPVFDVLPDLAASAPLATSACRYPRRELNRAFIERSASAFGVTPDLALPVLQAVARLAELSQEVGLVPIEREELLQALNPGAIERLCAELDASSRPWP